jgi:flagellar biosynthesis/type III secretory pathway protein FliH
MSYFMLPFGGRHLVGSASPLIKHKDRQAFTDSASLLRHAISISESSEAALDKARQAAWTEGYTAGAAAAQQDLSKELNKFSDAASAVADLHARNVAEAAYAATIAIIGEFEDSELVERIAAQVIAKQKEHDGITIQVSSDVCAQLAASMDGESSIPIEANDNLGPGDCHIITANGRIIANLSVQLAVLRDRWGIETKAESDE